MSNADEFCGFPREIYETIIQYLDGYSLMQAQLVCKQWKSVVEYLEKKQNIWKKCCDTEIPQKHLDSMLEKYFHAEENHDRDKWRIIYKNWYLLQQPHSKSFEIFNVLKQRDIITCTKISGRNLIVGTASGSIFGTDQCNANLFRYSSPYRSRVENLFLLNKVDGDAYFKHTHLLVFYKLKLVLYNFIDANLEQIISINRVTHCSIYKEFICCVIGGNSITVSEFGVSEDFSNCLRTVSSCRIYSPTVIRALSISSDNVFIVTNHTIMTFSYVGHLQIISAIVFQQLPFSTLKVQHFWAFDDEIIFASDNHNLCFTTINSDSSEVVYKNFCNQISALVCDIYLYVNNLFISTSDGTLYIYVVKNWNEFNLNEYNSKIQITWNPTFGVDVQELNGRQRLIISDSNSIHEIFLK